MADTPTMEDVHPPIVSREEWLAARTALLAKEKEMTRARDRLNAERRRLPMVRLEKRYEFDTTEGRKTLAELFDGKRQLIVYHFMFDPEWDAGCPVCTGFADALGDLSGLEERDATFSLISRAPLAKLQAHREGRGWSVPWVSSYGSDFNYDFQATIDPAVHEPIYNFRPAPADAKGETPGMSVFFRRPLEGGDEVYHTYSTFQRGVEGVTDVYSFLDLTPFGRQEDFEDSPEGWPQRPTYG